MQRPRLAVSRVSSSGHECTNSYRHIGFNRLRESTAQEAKPAIDTEGESVRFRLDRPKLKDYATSIAFTEEQACGQKFLRDFATACRKMSPGRVHHGGVGAEILADFSGYIPVRYINQTHNS